MRCVGGGLDFVEHCAGGFDPPGGLGVGFRGVLRQRKESLVGNIQKTEKQQQNEGISHHASLGR